MKKTLLSTFLFFIFFNSILAQSKEEQLKKMKSFKDSSEYYNDSDLVKSLEYAKKLSVIAEKLNDEKELLEAYYIIVNKLYSIGLEDESLEYANKGIPLAQKNNDIFRLSLFKEVKMYCYTALGYKDQIFDMREEIGDLLKDKEDDHSRRTLSRIDAHLGQYYSFKNELKLANKYFDKAINEFPVKEGYNEIKQIYIMKGYVLLDEKRFDSAYYYFKKSHDYQGDFHCNYASLTGLGAYYYAIKNYTNAIEYYTNALKQMESCKINDLLFRSNLYQYLSEIYELLENQEEKDKYLKLYHETNTEISKNSQDNLQAAVKSILNDKSSEIDNHKRKNIIITISIVFISFLIISWLIWQYLRLKKRKRKLVKEKEIQNSFLAEKNEHLVEEVKSKKFQELIDLAKSNNPEFLVLFKELYPNLIENLNTLNPDIRNSELSFCAYCYLNFSTKDISEYTFVTVAAVQSRKNRFRKRYNISSDKDFNAWMRELGDG